MSNSKTYACQGCGKPSVVVKRIGRPVAFTERWCAECYKKEREQ